MRGIISFREKNVQDMKDKIKEQWITNYNYYNILTRLLQPYFYEHVLQVEGKYPHGLPKISLNPLTDFEAEIYSG